MVRSVIMAALVFCILLSGCSNKTAVNGNREDSQATVGSTAAELTGSSETTPSIAVGKETEMQNSAKPQDNTMPDDGFTTEDSVLGTESSKASTAGTGATNPENEDNNIPGFGIELPDDNWD